MRYPIARLSTGPGACLRCRFCAGDRSPLWQLRPAQLLTGSHRVRAVRKEITEAEAGGCWAIKIATGSAAPPQDVQYIAEVLRGHKGGTRVWVDINGAWLTIAADVENQGRSVFPHFSPEPHAHLVASVPNAVATEVPPDWTTGLSALGSRPARLGGQKLRVPESPGFGLDWDFDAIERHSVRQGTVIRGA